MRAAARLARLSVSPIRLVSEGAPAGAIPLGLGEPTWPMPEVARRALASFGGVCSYGPQAGRVELRRAIAEYHAETGREHGRVASPDRGVATYAGAAVPPDRVAVTPGHVAVTPGHVGVTPDHVVVTNGAQEALYVLAQAFADPGSAVLVPDPGFVGYPAVAELAGARAVPYPLARANRFRLDASLFVETLERTPDARLAIVGHPANPTGAGASRADLAAVARACEERGVALVSDEVYRELHFGERPASLLDVADTGFVVSSVSKGFGSPGLRVGWIIGAPDRLGPVRVVHGYAVTCASSPAQLAATALIEARADVLPAARREVGARFEALRASAREHLGREVEPPDGGFYHFHPLPEAAHADPLAWCLRLRDEGLVVLIPGLAFGEGGRAHARLSFAAPPDLVAEGVRRLAAFVARERTAR